MGLKDILRHVVFPIVLISILTRLFVLGVGIVFEKLSPVQKEFIIGTA